MTEDSSVGGPHSLATAPSSTPLLVEDVMFEYVRAYCRHVGIARGTRVECLQVTETSVRVRLPDGSEVDVPLQFAHFVRLEVQDAIETGVEGDIPEPLADAEASVAATPSGSTEL